jgi:thiosulfate dehydrogenase (quinone) large subunit
MVAPERWIAVLRIVVGVWFLKAVWTKVTLEYLFGVVPYPLVSSRFLAFHPKRVAEFAAGNPVAWYKDFLEQVVLPRSALFATLQTYGEVAVGIGLVLGLVVGLTALVGIFLTVNFGLATQWMSFGQQGFHVLLLTSMVLFLCTRAGRAWGVDRWLARVESRWLGVLV